MSNSPIVITTWVLGILFILVVIGIIILAVIGNQYNPYKAEIPENIDVVLVDRGRNRLNLQLDAIDQYMPWVHAVFIIFTSEASNNNYNLSTSNEQLNIITIQTDKHDLYEILMKDLNQDDLSDNFIFFGDTTFPVNKMKPKILWSSSGKRRLFSYNFNNDIFNEFYEPTIPVMIINHQDLLESQNINNYIFSQALLEKVIYCPCINKNFILTNNVFTNEKQLNISSITYPKYFATFMIYSELNESLQTELNLKVLDWFSSSSS